jgi:glycosyltransferase involved in cell wall biosynthesis
VKKTILYVGCFSLDNWESIWQRENMLAEFLSKKHCVFYAWNAFNASVRAFLADLVCAVPGDWQLAAVGRLCESARHVPVLRAWRPEVIAGLADRHTRLRKIQAEYISRGYDLHFVQLPVALNLLTHAINSKVIVFKLRNLMRQHGISCFDTIIISNPTFFAPYVLNHIRTNKIIYDCGERYEYSGNHSRDVVQFEKSILEKADIVTADSVALRDEKSQMHDHVLAIVQGIDLNNYNANKVATAEEPSDLAAIGRPRIGYVGSFHQSVEVQLLAKLAKEIPEANLVLIGPEPERVQRRLAFPNVSFLGWKPYGELPVYLNFMDAFIIPYISTGHGEGVHPSKLWEYLFFQKPIIATALPDLFDYERYLYIGRTHDEFVRFTKRAVVEGENKLAAIPRDEWMRFLEQNSWESRFRAFEKLL